LSDGPTSNGTRPCHVYFGSAVGLEPVTTAVAHSCDEVSLEGAANAAGLKLTISIVIRQAERVRAPHEQGLYPRR
jgi:hypothetical protein